MALCGSSHALFATYTGVTAFSNEVRLTEVKNANEEKFLQSGLGIQFGVTIFFHDFHDAWDGF
jgi:hypothetical protein